LPLPQGKLRVEEVLPMTALRNSRGPHAIALLALTALTAAGCATIERDEVAAPANGGAVVMRTGTPLIVSLPADPAEGYGWVLQSSGPNLFVIGGPDYTPEPKPPGLVGVANTTTYRFRAKAPGTASLEFAWQSPPDQPPAPMRTVRYDVTIYPEFPDAISNWIAPGGAAGQPAVKY
jgi:inhibitor of cysteine peptidase